MDNSEYMDIAEQYQIALAKRCCSILSDIDPNFYEKYESEAAAELDFSLALSNFEGTNKLYNYLSSIPKENIMTTSRHMSEEDRKNWNNELLIQYDNLLDNLNHYCNSFETSELQNEESFVR